MLATTLAFLSFARVAMSDMLLALLSTLAVSLAVLAYRPGAPRFVVPLLGAVAGLGFATKGPIAVLDPRPRRSCCCSGRTADAAGPGRRPRHRARRRSPSPCSASAGSCWSTGGSGVEPLVYFFLRENLQRFAAETYDIGRPVWFYVPAYLAEGLPWSPFLPIALARLLRSADPATKARARFLALWPLLVLVPLSLSRGKIDYYLLPLYPAVSLLVGRYLAATAVERRSTAPGPGSSCSSQAAALVARARCGRPRCRPSGCPARSAAARSSWCWRPGRWRCSPRRLRPAPRRVLAGSRRGGRRARGCASSSSSCRPSPASQPNREIVEDVARERRYRPDLRMAFCSDPTRVRRDVLLEVRLAALAECDLWSLAGSREPFLLLVTPAQDASFRVDPRYRHIATYRYLPAEALTFGGLFSLSEPGEIMLGANFATRDPEARDQEEARVPQDARPRARSGSLISQVPRPEAATPRIPATNTTRARSTNHARGWPKLSV